jgi:cell division protein FtsB
MSPSEASAQSKSWRFALGATVAFVLVLMMTAGAKGWRDLSLARQREEVLQLRIERSKDGIRQLQRRLELLRDDPVTLERLALEELGMVRADDFVIVLPPRADGSPAP